MKDKENSYVLRMSALQSELIELQRDKISLRLNGSESSPEEIVCACAIAEQGTYMRDYIGAKGIIRQIDFTYVKER
ncbi:hypothetical protein [Novisyntrophococcus fermenticellae]|uniref:hypothetical protein n=1 Tax=Novisyntrophococcus fermenticellae TaxID=2068655 RepID=UPI001E3FE0EF|nr:hypothetical protein [Novisyntrophococcus fermenticellae]